MLAAWLGIFRLHLPLSVALDSAVHPDASLIYVFSQIVTSTRRKEQSKLRAKLEVWWPEGTDRGQSTACKCCASARQEVLRAPDKVQAAGSLAGMSQAAEHRGGLEL